MTPIAGKQCSGCISKRPEKNVLDRDTGSTQEWSITAQRNEVHYEPEFSIFKEVSLGCELGYEFSTVCQVTVQTIYMHLKLKSAVYQYCCFLGGSRNTIYR